MGLKKRKKRRRVARTAGGTKSGSQHTVRTAAEVVLDASSPHEDVYLLNAVTKSSGDSEPVDDAHRAIWFDDLSPKHDYELIHRRKKGAQASIFRGKVPLDEMHAAGAQVPPIANWYIHLKFTAPPKGGKDYDQDDRLAGELADYGDDAVEPKL
jgi:hypothetical protein